MGQDRTTARDTVKRRDQDALTSSPFVPVQHGGDQRTASLGMVLMDARHQGRTFNMYWFRATTRRAFGISLQVSVNWGFINQQELSVQDANPENLST